jgi:hypothetical protein
MEQEEGVTWFADQHGADGTHQREDREQRQNRSQPPAAEFPDAGAKQGDE